MTFWKAFFGALVAQLLTPGPTVMADALGGWKVKNDADPIEDTRTVVATLASEAKDATLTVRCSGKKRTTDVLLTWGKDLGRNYTKITARADYGEPVMTAWDIASDPKLAIYTGVTAKGRDLRPAEYAAKLMGMKTLVIRVVPQGESAITSTFDLTGADKALAQVAEACRWKE